MMFVSLYMDVNISGLITRQLRRRGIDVLTAQEDGLATTPDPQLLDRATELGRVFVSGDKHFLAEAARRQSNGAHFPGVIHLSGKPNIPIGIFIEQLELLAKAELPDNFTNQVYYLPL